MADPVPSQGFIVESSHSHLLSSCGGHHPPRPPAVPPSLLAQSLSLKNIAESDIRNGKSTFKCVHDINFQKPLYNYHTATVVCE